jgi:hypothetical protein
MKENEDTKETEAIKAFLMKMIEDLKIWECGSFNGNLDRVKFRKYQASVEPIEVIEEPKRKGKDGIRLRLMWKGEEGESCEAIIEIHIIPTRAGGPIVSIYIVDPATGKTEKCIKAPKLSKECFKTYNMYQMSIQDFCNHWVKYLARKDRPEIFIYKKCG